MIPVAASTSSRPAYRRQINYVDKSIQRSLLIALVVLEVVLVCASTWVTYWHLNDLLEQSLYRVHLVQTGPILTRLVTEGFAVLGVFALVNLTALMVAQRIWSRHENLVLKDFTKLIAKTRKLDFSSDPASHPQTEVLALAMAWRAQERTRFTAIRNQVAKLEASVSAGKSPQTLLLAVEDLNKLLS